MVRPDALRAVRAASVGELSYVVAGAVRVRGVLPLVGPRGPVLAFPFGRRSVAEQIASAAGDVVLTLTEPRGSGSAFEPLALRCHPRLSEDREGRRFSEELVDQELLRWPPARAYADSALLRREHWWWLPRVLVDLDVVDVEPFELRESARDHLLAVEQGSGVVDVALARIDEPALGDPGSLADVDVRRGTPGAGAAVLFGQDLSFPDLEQWGQWSWEGEWDGASFQADRAPRSVGRPPAAGLMQRWRRHRSLERACRRELRD